MNVLSFYRFVDIDDPPALRDELESLCNRGGLLGTVLLAPEGINGTLAGDEAAIGAVLGWLEQRLSLDRPLAGRSTEAAEPPFRRLRIRVKREIVTLGRPDVRANERAGVRVAASEWNRLLDDPDILMIDTRNHYEIGVGTFPGALDPGTDSFREFPAFAERLQATSANRPVAMFCTGGIRCEKASALMRELGFDRVYQLAGGILEYLSTVADEDNRWRGECFVFDTRVAVDRDLAEGNYVQCHACRRPLSCEDLESPDYRAGVSCPGCVADLDGVRRSRLEERRRQRELQRLRRPGRE